MPVISVYLPQKSIAALENRASDCGVTRHRMVNYAIAKEILSEEILNEQQIKETINDSRTKS